MSELLNHIDSDLKKTTEHLRSEYSRLQVGRASASLIDSLMVEAYGSKQAIKALANISIPDVKTIQIQPWDKSQLQAIEKAIMASGLNLTPNNDGIVIRINIPPLTEERRKDLVKVVNRLAEDARIGVRHARQTVMEKIKAGEHAKSISEDEAKMLGKSLQEKVDAVNKEIEMLAKNKENEVLKV